MLREGAQAPQPPPFPATPPAKPPYSRAADSFRDQLGHHARQANNLREKVVLLARQKEKENEQQEVRESTRLLSRQRSGKQLQQQLQQQQQQQQQQQDPLDHRRDISVYVYDLNSSRDASNRNADASCSGLSQGSGGHSRDGPGLKESRAGVQSLSTPQAPDPSRFLPAAALRSHFSRPRPPAYSSETDSSPLLADSVDVPGDRQHQRSSRDASHQRSARDTRHRNPLSIPTQVSHSLQGTGQINDSSLPEHHQGAGTTKLLTPSVNTVYRSRTAAQRVTAKSLRNPHGLVTQQKPADDAEEEKSSTPSTSPRSQNSQRQPTFQTCTGQTVSEKIPQKTTSALHRHSQSPSRSKESLTKPASQNVYGEIRSHIPSGRVHLPSSSPVRSADPHSHEKGDAHQDGNGQVVPGKIPSPPPEPSPRGRSVTVRRAARRILGAQHVTKDLQARPKTVRFLPDDSGRRNHSSGSSGGSPRQTASRGTAEEGVGEVKGNALPSTPNHLPPQGWPRRMDPRNPSHFASSLEMFKRRLKMNQQRIVTEKITDEEDYVIRLEHVMPLAGRTWQQAGHIKLKPSEPQPSPSAQTPQEQEHHHHHHQHQQDSGHHKLSRTHTGHHQTHTGKLSKLELMQTTLNFGLEEMTSAEELLKHPRSPGREDEDGGAGFRREGEGAEEKTGGGGGEKGEEGVKEHTGTTSSKLRESSENWTYVPLADRSHVPLPQVKTYVLENNATSLLHTRVHNHLPLALTQHNVRLHDIVQQRRSEREKMKARRTELEGRSGFVAAGERGKEDEGDNVRLVGRVASADAEGRMRRWLMDTEHQCDQQPLVNFKIAIPAA